MSDLTIEFHQQDFIPGFAAFLPKATTPAPNSRAFCVVNVGSLLAAVEAKHLPASELPYVVAESMMHEIMHALEQWAGSAFSEERVEALLERYRSEISSAQDVMDPGKAPAPEVAAGSASAEPAADPRGAELVQF